MRMFQLVRDVDHSGFSGIGVVAQGVEFADGLVILRWNGVWPTSVVFHDEGIESVLHLHSHGGDTRLEFLDALPTAVIEAQRAVFAEEKEERRLRRLVILGERPEGS